MNSIILSTSYHYLIRSHALYDPQCLKCIHFLLVWEYLLGGGGGCCLYVCVCVPAHARSLNVLHSLGKLTNMQLQGYHLNVEGRSDELDERAMQEDASIGESNSIDY